MMVMRAGLNQTRQDVLDYACQTVDLIVQVGQRSGARGVLQVYMSAPAKAGNDTGAVALRRGLPSAD